MATKVGETLDVSGHLWYINNIRNLGAQLMVKPGVTRKPFNMTLDEELVREAKKKAIDLGKPLYEFVEDALRVAVGEVPLSQESIDAQEGLEVKPGPTK